MANNGALTFGNFDEVMGFFGHHGIFQNRSKVTECKELWDLLRLYNCDDLQRETVTGNANYKMVKSQFNLFGFSQPDSSIKLITDDNGQRNGFPYRFFWYFPKPRYTSLYSLVSITQEKISHFEDELDTLRKEENEEEHLESEEENLENEEEHLENEEEQKPILISEKALEIAITMVKLSLGQQCIIVNGSCLDWTLGQGNTDQDEEDRFEAMENEPVWSTTLAKNIILVPGEIISSTMLIKAPSVRQATRQSKIASKATVMAAIYLLIKKNLGTLETFKGKNNKEVTFLKKIEKIDETVVANLVSIGEPVEDYQETLTKGNDESLKHMNDYNTKEPQATPEKRPRQE